MTLHDTYESLSEVPESHYYAALRAVLPEATGRMSDRQAEAALARHLRQMSPREREFVVESIGKIARAIGRGLAPHAGRIGALGGGALGTMLLGPGVGTALGTTVGAAIGGAVSGRPGPGSSPQRGRSASNGRSALLPRNRRPGAPRRRRFRTPAGPMLPVRRDLDPVRSNPASPSPSNQLLLLVNNPHFLVQILRAVIGGGRSRRSRQQVSVKEAKQLRSYAEALGTIARQLGDEATAQQRAGLDRGWVRSQRSGSGFVPPVARER